MKSKTIILLFAALAACSILLGVAILGYQDIQVITTPGNPASGYMRVFASGSQLGCLTSSGGNCLSGAGATIPSNCALITSNGTPTLSCQTAKGLASVAYVAGGGTANAQTATYSPAIATQADIVGYPICWLPSNANTGGATFNVNGLGAQTIDKATGSGLGAIVANDLLTTAVACAIWDGSVYELQNPQTGGGGSSPLTTKGDLYTFSSVNARLPVGSNGQCLTAQSGQATGLLWASCGAGSGITVGQGAFSSAPSCTNVLNEIYFPTDSYYTQLNCLTGASSYTYLLNGMSLNPPTAAASWTVVNGNSGTATIADSHGGLIFKSSSSVLGEEAALLAVPGSTPYTKTFAIKFAGGSGANTGSTLFGCGAGWSAGTTTSSAIQILRFMSYAPSGVPQFAWDYVAWTNFTFSSGSNETIFLPVNGPSPGAVFFIQLTDDGTNRKVSFSLDGNNYIQVATLGRTTPFTPTNYGVFCGGQNAAASVPYAMTILSNN